MNKIITQNNQNDNQISQNIRRLFIRFRIFSAFWWNVWYNIDTGFSFDVSNVQNDDCRLYRYIRWNNWLIVRCIYGWYTFNTKIEIASSIIFWTLKME